MPEFTFLSIDGAGDPSTADACNDAVEALYMLDLASKAMLKRDRVVPPLEGGAACRIS